MTNPIINLGIVMMLLGIALQGIGRHSKNGRLELRGSICILIGSVTIIACEIARIL